MFLELPSKMKRFLLLSLSIIVCLCSFAQQTDTIAQPQSRSLIEKVETWYAQNMNYATITLLMAVESSFIPFPSEVVIPPAAYVASAENSPLNKTPYHAVNVLIIVLFGTLGALIGALINYFLALWLGRPIVYAFADSKIGHLLLLDSGKIKKAEDYFNEHGKSSTFIGRFIPAIRQLISIPAGLAKMPMASFVFYTTLGALCWNIVLAVLGYVAHGQQDLIHQYSHELSIVLIALFVVGVVYVLVKAIKKNKKQ